ncbi:MAG TPA: molybdopterin-dependent oxidoreductase, partial [Nannocystaceae bacterium]|nr:molybdopterin-dependent oxidoreductase [Nannocystaceae bacterium]
FCRICESLCGLEVTMDGERVVKIRPNETHVATRGFACIKGLNQHELYGSPDRLLWPLARKGGAQVRASWAEATADIGRRVAEIRDRHGGDAIALYVGTAAGFGALHPVFAQGFMNGLGSRNTYSSATQDCANKFAVAQHVYGFPFTQPFPDVDRTRCLVIVGANPAVSKWSFLHVANPVQRLKEIEARGGKVWIVDPRRTETAKSAGRHVFIRPDTDVFFYLAFLHELLRTGAVDRERVAAQTTGFARIAALAEPWTPERCAEVTGIAAVVLREMVADYVAASADESAGAALYSSTGVNMGRRGTLGFWLQECINAIAGNLDRRGGTLVGKGVLDFPGFAVKRGLVNRRDKSRVGGFPSVNDTFPGGLLADEILTPGPGQVRALFVTGGNPLLTMANSGRLREAFARLELLVVLDILPSETAAMAHWVLPCTSPLERPDLPFSFPFLLGMQSRPYVQATRRVLAPAGEARDEATIYVELAKACGSPIFGSRIAQRMLEWSLRKRDGDAFPSIPQERLLSLLLRLGGLGGFAKLAARKDGVLRSDHAGGDFLGKRVFTTDGKVALAPAVLLESAQSLADDYAHELADRGRLKLITRRAITSHNSWTHNHAKFVQGERGTNWLYMHPDDARQRGLADGELADVSTDVATVRVPVRYHDELMVGTVALPHGWGHQVAPGLGVASRTRGVNVNLLAADGPDRIDRVSGMAHLTGLVVDVRPAAGVQAPTWSGL